MHLRRATFVLFTTMPMRVRLSIVGLTSLLSLTLFAWVFLPSHNGSILVIPVAMAAWLLRWRGTLVCLGALMVALIVLNSLSIGTIRWPPSLLLTFLAGSGGLLVEGAVIRLSRAALDLAHTAQRKAELAELQISRAYEQQRQLNRFKDRFLLQMSHELATPLTQVYGALELLGEYHGHLDAPTQATLLTSAKAGCQELILLTDAMLHATQPSSTTALPPLERCSIAPIVRDVLSHLEPGDAHAYNVQQAIPDELTVWADPRSVRQILRNLLSNVFKYCPKKTTVIISAALSRLPQDKASSPSVEICVKDEGPGIPPDELPLLFDKCVRLQRDLAGTVPGAGLGLYLSKQLAEAMGGRMWVESSGQNGEGCCFYFTLPAIPPGTLEASTPKGNARLCSPQN